MKVRYQTINGHCMEAATSKYVKEHMAEILTRVEKKTRYTITRHGKDVAVILPHEEWQAIELLLQQIQKM